MTKEELAKYNGKEGNKAYVGFEGKVYDVTASALWKDGVHKKKLHAGNDLTGEMEKAPHGKEVLERFEVVDTLE
ncbi:MAG: cytochrome b5 domain-containing protein [Campylobacterota bacterium]